MFHGMGTEVRAYSMHNVHENINKIKEGGTGLLPYDNLINYLDIKKLGNNKTGIGRWVFYMFTGEEGVHMCRMDCDLYHKKGGLTVQFIYPVLNK